MSYVYIDTRTLFQRFKDFFNTPTNITYGSFAELMGPYLAAYPPAFEDMRGAGEFEAEEFALSIGGVSGNPK